MVCVRLGRVGRVAAIAVAAFAASTLIPATPLALQSPSAPPAPTFTRDVAPLLYAQCVSCHRPRGSAPFSLLTYGDAAPRGQQLVRAVTSRVMPPWKPEPGHSEFVGARRLTSEQIAVITRWVETGAAEGDPANLPRAPRFREGWQLGQPDLVITMPETYVLAASGHDVFRNFVVAVPRIGRRYVAAWEFRPGNAAVVHHATIGLDRRGAARALDDRDPAPGYEGVVPFSVQNPEGYFLGWSPGQQQPQRAIEGLTWPLDGGTDLVLSMHLRPSGRDERVQASLGLYFTDAPPSRVGTVLRLGRQDIDIPAGASRYVITNAYTLPVDVELHSVYPHAHHLATEMRAWATLPDQTGRELLFIRSWDFNWQDVYRYVEPLALPAGTTVTMEFVYANPMGHRVTYGPNSHDEMGDLWLQVVPRDRSALERLTADFGRKLLPETIAGLEMTVRQRPDDIGLHDELGLLYLEASRWDRAAEHFAASLRLAPASFAAHNNLATALLPLGRIDEARRHLGEALRLNPNYAYAHFNVGLAAHLEGKLDEAIGAYRKALVLRPDWPGARAALEVALSARRAAPAH